MNREAITVLLQKATEHTVSFARTMVSEKLPGKIGYRIRSELGIPQAEVLAETEVIDLIWSDAGILRWVDLAVCGSDDSFTYIGIDLSRDRVREESSTVYYSRGMGPFGIKSPALPANWKSVEQSGRFKIQK